MIGRCTEHTHARVYTRLRSEEVLIDRWEGGKAIIRQMFICACQRGPTRDLKRA
jgi:hypothetical protein